MIWLWRKRATLWCALYKSAHVKTLKKRFAWLGVHVSAEGVHARGVRLDLFGSSQTLTQATKSHRTSMTMSSDEDWASAAPPPEAPASAGSDPGAGAGASSGEDWVALSDGGEEALASDARAAAEAAEDLEAVDAAPGGNIVKRRSRQEAAAFGRSQRAQPDAAALQADRTREAAAASGSALARTMVLIAIASGQGRGEELSQSSQECHLGPN